jgi:regulator of cell morphogenesis and NO signaling
MLTAQTTLAELAVKQPAASKVFQRYRLDFCCHGNRPLQEACDESGLAPETVLAEIESEGRKGGEVSQWAERPLPELIAYIVNYYHRRLREELPLLVAMASRVEHVHREKTDCPRGLAHHLEFMHQAVLYHLVKEELILFPMIEAGAGSRAAAPVHTLEIEHEDHGASLRTIRRITSNFAVPPEACATWAALYRRLEDFETELMEHIHMENNILFRRALCE